MWMCDKAKHTNIPASLLNCARAYVIQCSENKLKKFGFDTLLCIVANELTFDHFELELCVCVCACVTPTFALLYVHVSFLLTFMNGKWSLTSIANRLLFVCWQHVNEKSYHSRSVSNSNIPTPLSPRSVRMRRQRNKICGAYALFSFHTQIVCVCVLVRCFCISNFRKFCVLKACNSFFWDTLYPSLSLLFLRPPVRPFPISLFALSSAVF